jgi:hypothetical protein
MAIHLALLIALVSFSPPDDNGRSPTFALGLVALALARGAFEWSWNRRPGAD